MRLIFVLFVFFFLINFNSVVFSPFFPHILDAWSKRHHPNMHFMFYEDMKRVYRTLSSLFPILSVKSYKLYFVYMVYVCDNRICAEKSRKWPPSSGNRTVTRWWQSWRNIWNSTISRKTNLSIMNPVKKWAPWMKMEDLFAKVCVLLDDVSIL